MKARKKTHAFAPACKGFSDDNQEENALRVQAAQTARIVAESEWLPAFCRKNRQSAMVTISHSGRQIIQGRFPIATSNPQRGKGGRRESLHRGFSRIGQDSRKRFPASGGIRRTCSLWHGRSDHESRTETCARGTLWSATLRGKHSRKSRKARLTPSARRAFGAEPVSL